MTFTEAIINWIASDPDNPKVSLDLLPQEQAGNALSPTERDVVVRKYINGRARRRFTAALYACRQESDKLDAINTMDRLQAFLEAGKGQTIGGLYQLRQIELTTPSIKNRVGDWVFYGSAVTIEYSTI